MRVREGAHEVCHPFGLAAWHDTVVRPLDGAPGLRMVGHRGRLKSAIRLDSIDGQGNFELLDLLICGDLAKTSLQKIVELQNIYNFA